MSTICWSSSFDPPDSIVTSPRDDPSHLLDDGVLPSSQRNKLREILDARDDVTIESGASKDELQQMVDKYS